MKKLLLLITLLFFSSPFQAREKPVPDTVWIGFYINSIHDIDFKDKQYTISLWLWLKYKKPEFDFSKYLEVPMAKTVDKSFYTVDTLDDGRIYMLMKLQCVMKDSWKIRNFPFDKQKLRFTIENSQYDASALIFAEDTVGSHYSKWTLSGWKVIADSLKISTGIKKYETAFGDPAAAQPRSEFGNFKVTIGIERDSWLLFLKLFTGMYISFLLTLACFFIHTDSLDSRFSLSVGALFATIGNKYVADSSLPESTSFTLVDTLHGITLCFIFVAVCCSARTLKLIKQDKLPQALRLDRIAIWSLTLIYLVLNAWFIYRAYYNQLA
jgi:hypothetical protein